MPEALSGALCLTRQRGCTEYAALGVRWKSSGDAVEVRRFCPRWLRGGVDVGDVVIWLDHAVAYESDVSDEVLSGDALGPFSGREVVHRAIISARATFFEESVDIWLKGTVVGSWSCDDVGLRSWRVGQDGINPRLGVIVGLLHLWDALAESGEEGSWVYNRVTAHL